MSKSEKDLEIVSELAKEIAEENDSTETSFDDNRPDENATVCVTTEEIKLQKNSKRSEKKRKKLDKGKPALTLKELAAKKQNQNLAERKGLLVILTILLGLQLLFMNTVVLLIVVWISIRAEFLREVDPAVLTSILDFTKYYVTAVLVELLGGIIYIVHRVFSEKN